ncbi:hypothetical protein F383_19194 [Gossypium arboreum]|uniref:Uncharacterized protein n=1 Tax=Gossypium arboreum TaxID=29729 RepID=A0A0B0NJ98_GOSAR|nr:hypothetical protein F383_19194 [Gossypium arboreum]
MAYKGWIIPLECCILVYV